VRPLTVFLNGDGITEPGLRGEEIVDDSFLLMLNPGHEDVAMTLPDGPFGSQWELVLDTVQVDPVEDPKPEAADSQRVVTARSVVVMRRV
jgi:glycogen operon protein